MSRDSLYTLVSALCLDYSRREKAIDERSVSHRTEMEFRYYNFKIFDAAAEIVGEDMARVMIDEIGSRTGYAGSACEGICEKTYKVKKKLTVENIARRLHLTDK